jgi:hypothetical protein
VLALIGCLATSAVVNGEARRLLGRDLGHQPKSTFDRLVGQWNHITSGESIIVTRSRDVWLTAGPQARVEETAEAGGNFAFEGRSNRGAPYRCVYYITFLHGNDQTNWRLQNTTEEVNCPVGIFARQTRD